MSVLTLQFDKGSLVLPQLSDELAQNVPEVKWDPRARLYRAPARAYRSIVLALRDQNIPHEDQARAFKRRPFALRESIEPRPYQIAALQAWMEASQAGVVVLPTGAGKTILAMMVIERTERPALIHVPTIDLMHQWLEVLRRYFDIPVGLLGGGYHEWGDITVATYDSALIHVTNQGNRFGLAIYDECHHLPSEQNQYTALANLAPFRLGLTATPERSDGKEQLLYQLIGPLCYRVHIDELEGKTLANYRVETVEVDLTEEEWQLYQTQRAVYTDFLKSENIDMSQPNGWKSFLWKSSQSARGRQAFTSYLAQKKLSQASSAKEAEIWRLLQEHRGDRTLIFTQDNETAYRIGKRFLLPVLTHQTKLKERNVFLDAFRSGHYRVLVTSKVLNEGIDVPEANVAIIVSGSGSIREHVQRLGRILRAQPGKQAILYELVSAHTGEHYVNQRRRQHRAYERFG